MAGKEFEQLVLAIVRNLPLKEPNVLTVKGLRRILFASDGVSARIFRWFDYYNRRRPHRRWATGRPMRPAIEMNLETFGGVVINLTHLSQPAKPVSDDGASSKKRASVA